MGQIVSRRFSCAWCRVWAGLPCGCYWWDEVHLRLLQCPTRERHLPRMLPQPPISRPCRDRGRIRHFSCCCCCCRLPKFVFALDPRAGCPRMILLADDRDETNASAQRYAEAESGPLGLLPRRGAPLRVRRSQDGLPGDDTSLSGGNLARNSGVRACEYDKGGEWAGGEISSGRRRGPRAGF